MTSFYLIAGNYIDPVKATFGGSRGLRKIANQVIARRAILLDGVVFYVIILISKQENSTNLRREVQYEKAFEDPQQY